MLNKVDGTSLMGSSYSPDYDSYIEFGAAGNAARGLAACNGFSGRFAAGSRQLRITQLSSTQGCSPFSNRYRTALLQTTRYEIAGRTLRLYDGSAQKPRLVFEAAP